MADHLWHDTLTLILAGGEGQRLYPLTRDRAKPAVPFGGIYRIVDFTLSNCLNSGCSRVYVLTQYKSFSLDRHLRRGWYPLFDQPELGRHLNIMPPQQRTGEGWYLGTADAINQNIYTLERERPKHVMILSGDHVYKMNYRELLQRHIDCNAELTVACVPVPKEEAFHFGIMATDADGRVVGFQEKPRENPATLPDNPDRCLASMGVYIFRTETLVRRVTHDARLKSSAHDFGKNIIPDMVAAGEAVHAMPFGDMNKKAQPYWRDVGTLDSYYEANMDLVSVSPLLNLYDEDWPIRTCREHVPPAKFVFADPEGLRRGQAFDSLVSAGVIVSGGTVVRSILSPNVRINSYSVVEDAVLMNGVDVGRHAVVRRAIVDKRVCIPPGTHIGCNPKEDRRRFAVTASGIVVVPKEMVFPKEPPVTPAAPHT